MVTMYQSHVFILTGRCWLRQALWFTLGLCYQLCQPARFAGSFHRTVLPSEKKYTNMRLYGGSYERFLFGFEVSNDDGALSLDQVLSIPAHKSAVKCMDTAGNVVVTGGADDQIHLFNMRSNTDLGFLINPAEGPVPCVTFVSAPESQQPRLLLSGAAFAHPSRCSRLEYAPGSGIVLFCCNGLPPISTYHLHTVQVPTTKR